MTFFFSDKTTDLPYRTNMPGSQVSNTAHGHFRLFYSSNSVVALGDKSRKLCDVPVYGLCDHMVCVIVCSLSKQDFMTGAMQYFLIFSIYRLHMVDGERKALDVLDI